MSHHHRLDIQGISGYWGVALSGGGARGAYQYGVWQVLRETPLIDQVRVISGTSIGAINAVLFMLEKQTGKDLAHTFWEEADLSAIFTALPPGKHHLRASDYLRLAWDGLQHGGIRVAPLKQWLRTHLDLSNWQEEAGCVWINSWDARRFREETKRFPGTASGEFLEWIMGSASFPLFGPHRYQNYWLLDGGIANNLPLHLAFGEPAIERVLAVDLATFMRFHPRQLWLERRYAGQVTFLRVGYALPSPVAFSRTALDALIRAGREDARCWWNRQSGQNAGQKGLHSG